jgi:hypothetical protein
MRDRPSSGTGRVRSAPAQAGENLIKFESSRTNALRPVVFQPNGSFKCLKENGKLSVGPDDPTYAKGRGRAPDADSAYFMPGYTGFVRGGQHISGRTFGETTRRALGSDYRDIVCTSPIPSTPQANRRIRHEELQDTFVHNMFGGKTYHIPGYTGFVPGVRGTYSKCYGSATQQEMDKNATINPRPARTDAPGFASTAIPRQYYNVDSAPLPGGAKSQQPPDMYIPSHIRYLKFFPM